MKQEILKKLIEFRQELHQYPETSFKQYQTRQRVKKMLTLLGVDPKTMIDMEPTALIVDLVGEGQPSGNNRCIAFRADMDALSMVENNHHLTYRSKNQGAAHMCGHDGHMTCLIGFVSIFLQNIKNIPKNKTIRLLFQPSEEGPESGAKLMIEKGCLEGVDQVYGFHNWPTAPVGQLWCKQGAVMSQITVLKIDIIGTGGHGSEPQKLKQCIRGAIKFYQKVLDYLDNLKKQKNNTFVCTLPIFQTGQRFNVISQKCHISGSIRSFEEGLNMTIIHKFEQYLKELEEEGFKTKLEYVVNAPVNFNTQKESQHVIRVGKLIFGQDKVGPGKLPFRASQDFAYFTKHKPGAFFFLSTSKGQGQVMLHNQNFDFNDNLIEKAAIFWYKLATDRLEL